MRNPLKLSLLVGGLVVSSVANAELIYAVSFDNQLITFDSATPDNIESGLFLQGLNGGATVAGIDFRPSTGELYVVSTDSRIYTANLTTGQLTQKSQLTSFLNGIVFGVDFNPVADLLRITTNTQQNLRVNVDTGNTTVDSPITVGGDTNPRVTGAAYSNNVAGAGSTTLYGLETKTNSLVQFSSPNAGTATVVGPLGFAASGLNGFDISGTTGIAYAAVQIENVVGSRLYTVNLGTGSTTLVGAIDGVSAVSDIRALTVAPVPEPATLAVVGIGVAAMLRRRKRS